MAYLKPVLLHGSSHFYLTLFGFVWLSLNISSPARTRFHQIKATNVAFFNEPEILSVKSQVSVDSLYTV